MNGVQREPFGVARRERTTGLPKTSRTSSVRPRRTGRCDDVTGPSTTWSSASLIYRLSCQRSAVVSGASVLRASSIRAVATRWGLRCRRARAASAICATGTKPAQHRNNATSTMLIYDALVGSTNAFSFLAIPVAARLSSSQRSHRHVAQGQQVDRAQLPMPIGITFRQNSASIWKQGMSWCVTRSLDHPRGARTEHYRCALELPLTSRRSHELDHMIRFAVEPKPRAPGIP